MRAALKTFSKDSQLEVTCPERAQRSQTAMLVLAYPLIWLIHLYQAVVSPWLAPACRFTPSCSRYAVEALQKHGVFRGAVMAVKRILKCHPFSAGGYDPVR